MLLEFTCSPFVANGYAWKKITSVIQGSTHCSELSKTLQARLLLNNYLINVEYDRIPTRTPSFLTYRYITYIHTFVLYGIQFTGYPYVGNPISA